MSGNAGLHLHTSNRLETLAGFLAGSLRTPLSSPFVKETIVVQSQGMARWLKLELARQHGVCANVRFPFPREFTHEVFTAALPDLPKELPGRREVMAWQIMRVLPGLVNEASFAPVAEYLAEQNTGQRAAGILPAVPPLSFTATEEVNSRQDAGSTLNERRRIQLANKIADLFDQYLVFRPELIERWDAGEDDGWQAQLWRAITGGKKLRHLAALRREFNGVIEREQFQCAGLPERVSVFGISALPTFHLEVIAALGAHLPVHLFVLQPSEEYWGDIVSARLRDKILRRTGQPASAAEDLHLTCGNRLLASMGKLGQDFLNLIYDSGDWQERREFSPPEGTSLLTTIQSDILHLRERGSVEVPRLAVRAGDDSVQIHSCHSPMRELEVLHDQLLAWFAADPKLEPRDVLVMTPDIEACAPFIQAVFDSPEDEARRIPFSLADRTPRRESHLAGVFFSILDLARGRCGAADVLSVLEAPPVCAKFDLNEHELETIRQWIDETRIRWGRDATHRDSLELPALPGNTWRAGLDRLLLGYAMRGCDGQLFDGILPFDAVEGQGAEALGRFVDFVEHLFATLDRLEQSHALAGWETILHGVLDDFFAATANHADELTALRQAIASLARDAATADFTEPVALSVVLEPLAKLLEEEHRGAGYLTGGVTFCALKPMRSIPFKVICLIGMNDAAFPRAARHLGFDLMARHPKRGDRSARDDDRYLFLETILSARERLHLSYIGQSIRDNKPAPPSVVVSELLDVVVQGFTFAGEPAEAGRRREHIEKQLVTRHRLQAFSDEYFRGGPLFSFSTENCRASEAALRSRRDARALFAAPLGEPGAEFRNVSMDTLAGFLSHPAKFFARTRLKLELRDTEGALDDREAFALGGLDGYSVKEQIVAQQLAGVADDVVRAAIRAEGRLPLGAAGETALTAAHNAATAFRQQLLPELPAAPREPVAVDLPLGPFRLGGNLTRFGRDGLLHFRCASLKSKDRLRLWIEHLAWCASGGGGASVLVGEDETVRFAPVKDAPARLAELLEVYWQGLAAPLKFFPKSSFTYAVVRAKGSKADPFKAAQREWMGNEFSKGSAERDDPYFDLIFGSSNPLDDEFALIAHAVYEPLLANTAGGDA